MAKIATMQAAPSKAQQAANKKKYEESQSIFNKIGDWWTSQKNIGGTNVPGYIQRNYEGSGLQKILGGGSTGSTGSYKGASLDKLSDYDTDYLYSLYGGGGSGSGGYSVAKADISGLLDAYEQQAAAARQNAETKYANTRSDLLTSLKRFQEQNAQDVLNQKQSYLSEQSNLESARESANRQNRISAAARGIGGSGLQQLAQLQNLMGQSEDISQAAGNNQKAMDKLAALLRDYQEDNDTKLRQNEEERTNTLNSIAANLANQRAQAIAENEQNYVNALNSMRAQAAAGSASNSAARQMTAGITGALYNLTSNLDTVLKNVGGKNEKQLKAYIKNSSSDKNSIFNKYKGKTDAKSVKNYIQNYYNTALTSLVNDYGLDQRTTRTAQENINKLLKAYNVK